ncbi:MAG TPA: PmoA family protein [Ktedonobacteraceae bacterium]|nr:PmoA family protein [Ktedonobacteraceae bacterium]
MSYDHQQSTSPEAEALVAHHIEQQNLVWTAGEHERLVYHYATDRRKAFVHPLYTAQGDLLTALEPADHPWHRGLWFAWKYLNDVNFWEETTEGIQDGRTEFVGIDTITSQAGQARVTIHYNYREPSGTILLTEQRTLQINVPPVGPATIDWDATFTTGAQSVTFDRTVISPETPWGGYAGLSFRPSPMWQNVQAQDSEGRHNLDIKHKRARWVQMTGTHPGGQRSSIVVLDHPANLRYPCYWYYADETDPLGFAYINPSPLLAEPHTIAPHTPLRLHYRIFLLDDALEHSALETLHEDFVRQA